MCYAAFRLVYFRMHYDANRNNKPARRTAAGCPRSNRCNTNPPTPSRITCDEYPFASTHGTGANGWYSGTGATTRCVSLGECRSQGGSLSTFYQSFGRVDGTPVDVVVTNYNVSPWCVNPNMAPDANFRTGTAPPVRRGGLNETSTDARSVKNENGTFYEYLTAANRTILSLTGSLDIGSQVFVPNAEWDINPKVKGVLSRRQDENDDCDADSFMDAVSLLGEDELGEFDRIVERLQ
ncbi:hypothetical protein VNI00_004942 [Paramarasmius palmivorus]|uniref:Deoxyribonuclease NucA/NucB domain-containing protein n=1 Tax=Paramarasmius palmivorus TaxID=297713 RepID=A0AAW0DEC6_9AGAR